MIFCALKRRASAPCAVDLQKHKSVPTFQTTTTTHHDAHDMFTLVGDVESYPQFVPLCENLIIRASDVDGHTRTLITDMTIAYKALRETVSCKVVLDEAALTVHSTQVAGPFAALDNRWAFTGSTSGTSRPDCAPVCEIEFFLAYELKNRLLGAFVGAFFDRFFSRYRRAFEARADVVYASPAPCDGDVAR